MKTTHNRFYKQKTPPTEKQRGLHPLKTLCSHDEPAGGNTGFTIVVTSQTPYDLDYNFFLRKSHNFR